MQIITVETPLLKSNMYLLVENRKSVVIDPYWDEEVKKILHEEVEELNFVFLTHEHYDHISGVNEIKKYYHCKVWASEVCANRIKNTKDNFSRYFDAYAAIQTGVKNQAIPHVNPYVCRADCTFNNYVEIIWMNYKFEVFETPGHSPGSICIYVDKKWLFSGDTLISSSMPITRFPDGDQKIFDEVTLPRLEQLPKNTKVFPGHYQSFYLGSHNLMKNGGN